MYESLVFALSSIVLMCIAITWARRKSLYKVVVCTVTAVYVIGVLYLVLLRGGRSGIFNVSLKPPLYFFNAIRSGKYGVVVHRSLLNLLLFIPFGYLFPNLLALRERRSQWWQVILCGFFTSLLIETCQLIFHRGAFELDDLVKNTMGSAVGWLIWRLSDKIVSNRTSKKENDNG